MPWETSWWNRSWGFLQGHFLIVAIHCLEGGVNATNDNYHTTHLLRVDRERTFTLAVRTITDLHFLGCILVKRTQNSTALATVKFHILQLRENPGTTSNNTRDPDEIIQVRAAEVTKR